LNTTLKLQKKLILWRDSNRLLQYVVSTSVFISLISVTILLDSCLLLNVDLKPTIFVSAFCLTFTVYNLDRLDGSKEDTINDAQKLSLYKGKMKTWTVLLSTALTLCFLLLLETNASLLLVYLVPLISSILYGKSVLFFPRLKNVPVIKNVVLVSTWTLMATAIPSYSSNIQDTLRLLLISYFLFIKLLVNSILFDLRDIQGDSAAGVRTLPVILGRETTYRLLVLINSTLVPWLMICRLLNYFLPHLPMLTFSIVYGFGYIKYFNTKRPRILFDLIVDGEWIPFTVFLL
jgi:4-hydroxybenzoate polyprenyltransferase